MAMVYELAPSVIYNFFIQGLDKRLDNPGCMDLACIATKAAEKGMDIQDVIAIPE